MDEEKRKYITIDSVTCFKWLRKAHGETLNLGYFQSQTFEELSNSTLSTVADREMGLVESINIKGRKGCKRWVDLNDKPTHTMAENLLVEYRDYGKKHKKNRPVLEIDDDGKAVDINPPLPELMAEADQPADETQLDRVERMVGHLYRSLG